MLIIPGTHFHAQEASVAAFYISFPVTDAADITAVIRGNSEALFFRDYPLCIESFVKI